MPFHKNHHLFVDGSEEGGRQNQSQINYCLHMLCFAYLAKKSHNSDARQLLSRAFCVQQTIYLLEILLHSQKAVRVLLLVPVYVAEFPYESMFTQLHVSLLKKQGRIHIKQD